ncbi:GerAB/ArcD/ProY family transporter [Clostridium sp. DL1XJH146]
MGNKIISKYDFFVTVVVTVIGAGIFSLPSELAKEVGADGWIVTLLLGAIFFIIVSLQAKAVEINNYSRLDVMLQNNFGKIIGKAIICLIIVSSLVIISLELRTFTEVFKMFLLEKTPTELIIIIMILVGVYLVRGEFENVIMFNEVIFFIIFIPLFLSFPFILNGADITNILPVFDDQISDYIFAMKRTIPSFSGFSIIYMIHPFLSEKRDLKKSGMKSVFFITLVYTIIIIISLAVFPKEYNKELLWPTISMVSIVEIPGAFLERWEGIAMSFWTLFIFSTFVNLFYFSSSLLENTFNLKDVKITSLMLAPIIYMMALYPESISQLYAISAIIMPYMDMSIILVLPIILIIFHFFKKKVNKNAN